ncbi:MAG TPA: DNA polymerase III subunit epsilon [Hyphomicrobiales bacterium]|nr:DNA polymerase III subunit epsilon [Hyphomicrobiales bacterium]
MRQIVLDTETTGLDPAQGHRVIEIGCVEMVDRKLTRRHLHLYINPEREVDAGALEVHGITNEFLRDKPLFAAVAESFLDFVRGAELIIHNAPFDIGFLDHELRKLGVTFGCMADHCGVIDSLALARKKHPGQKNNLDALCKRYEIDNSHRELHGALKDAEILADVYLLMTGGQSSLHLGYESGSEAGGQGDELRKLSLERPPLRILRASNDELEQHSRMLAQINKSSSDHCLWLALDSEETNVSVP